MFWKCKIFPVQWAVIAVFHINTAGLETYFFSNSQTFASGFSLNSQIAVSNSQLVLQLFQRVIHSTMYFYWFKIKCIGSKVFEREKRKQLTQQFQKYRITGIFCGCLIFAEFWGFKKSQKFKIAKYSNTVIMMKSCPKRLFSHMYSDACPLLLNCPYNAAYTVI